MCVEYFIRYLPCQRADRTIIRNEITPIITSRWNKRLIFDAISLGQYANEIYIFQYILILIDSFSKWGWTCKAQNKSAVTFLKYSKNIFLMKVYRQNFHTYNGRKFINDYDVIFQENFKWESHPWRKSITIKMTEILMI